MKINKKTFLVCTLLVIVFGLGIAILNIIANEEAVLVNIFHDIFMGVFTGAIVSGVVALIGYFHERRSILERTNDNLKSLYINLLVQSKIIGDDLQYIHTATDFSGFHFSTISGLSTLNITFLNEMNIQLYSPFQVCGKGVDKFSEDYLKLYDLKQSFYNIKHIAMDLEILTLEYTNKALKIKTDQGSGIQISKEREQDLDMHKNLINIRTAKFHEYVTSKLLELESLANSFYKHSKNKWDDIKKNLLLQVEDIMRRQ